MIPCSAFAVDERQSIWPHLHHYRLKLASFANIKYTVLMKTCNPKYANQIPDLIRQATGSIPLHVTPIPTFPDTIVYEAQLPTGSVIFKTIDPDGRDPDGIGLEAWMCDTVRTLGVPAPRVLAVDTSRSR